jgi:hypothetical protein
MPISAYYKGSGRKVMKRLQAEYGPEKGKRVFYAMANKKGMKPKSYMPRGAEMSPQGDIGAHRGAEADKVFPTFHPGRTGACAKALTYRKPASANDAGGTSGGMA